MFAILVPECAWNSIQSSIYVITLKHRYDDIVEDIRSLLTIEGEASKGESSF